MNEGIISPKLDIMFKSMFSQEENEDMLHDFLATALDLSYDSIKKLTYSIPMFCPMIQTASSAVWI